MSLAASSRAEFKVRFRSGPGVLRIDPPAREGFVALGAGVFVIVWWMKALSDRVMPPVPSNARAIDGVSPAATKPGPAINAAELQMLRDDWQRYATTRDALHDEFMAQAELEARSLVARAQQ